MNHSGLCSGCSQQNLTKKKKRYTIKFYNARGQCYRRPRKGPTSFRFQFLLNLNKLEVDQHPPEMDRRQNSRSFCLQTVTVAAVLTMNRMMLVVPTYAKTNTHTNSSQYIHTPTYARCTPATRSLRALVSVCVSMRGPVPWQCRGGGGKYHPIWCKHPSAGVCAWLIASLCKRVMVILRFTVLSVAAFIERIHSAVHFFLFLFLCIEKTWQGWSSVYMHDSPSQLPPTQLFRCEPCWTF